MNPSRVHLEHFLQAAAAALPSGGRVFDAGAGDGRYKRFFEDPRFEYESADFCQLERPYADLTYVCDLKEIPVEDARFDLIVCSQVLEHTPEPRAVLAELARVLKPGGQLWLSTPLYYPEHEPPYDFFRYTQFALRRLMEDAGLEVQRIEWLEGYSATVGHQLRTISRCLPRRPGAFGGGIQGLAAVGLALGVKAAFRPLAGVFDRLDLRHKHTRSGHCKNYTVVATKPGSAS